MKIPRSTQEMIPVKHILNDGTFVLDSGEYSKMFAFTDINYTELRDEEKMRRLVIIQHCSILSIKAFTRRSVFSFDRYGRSSLSAMC